jgi:hypothetical protein
MALPCTDGWLTLICSAKAFPMKHFLLSLFLYLIAAPLMAQNNQVESLPAGTYETMAKNKTASWERGNIIILDDRHYKTTSDNLTGEYRFSVTAQRIFFTSGSLKSVFAKATVVNSKPVIVLPLQENEQIGMKLPDELWCYLR